MPSPSPQPDRVRLAWPVLIRAAAALAFGGATVFWGRPTTAGAAWVFAAYVWLLLADEVWLLRSERPGPSRGSALTGLVGFALAAIAAVVPLVAPADGVLAGTGAAALVLVGASDVARGLIARRAPSSGVAPLARDLLLVGIVTVGAGILLPFFAGLGPHAILGVAGGAAVIAGVLLAIAGLSLRHDAAAAARVA
ncbi:hypothetical protein [Sinomonas sp. ASV322]|uniref:hypothetical protein n=1 Tax=Sinomonas sp. ASV322 TaxID=3041920 RepID=UPI0027DC3D6A|nr:hypothetical protein [Sinomonas sp. ASV322]MDQ4503971.1 hypothetical protein [Sinomonas sp. ASV322]